MLQQATVSGRQRLLHIAIDRAKKSDAFTSHAGSDGQALLMQAEQKFEVLQKEYRVARRLDGASIVANARQLEQALHEAETLGVRESKEVIKARELLSRIQQGEDVATEADRPVADHSSNTWRQRHRITRLPFLRDRSFPLYCSTAALSAPLLDRGDNDATYSSQAIAMSASIVACMWPNGADEINRYFTVLRAAHLP